MRSIDRVAHFSKICLFALFSHLALSCSENRKAFAFSFPTLKACGLPPRFLPDSIDKSGLYSPLLEGLPKCARRYRTFSASSSQRHNHGQICQPTHFKRRVSACKQHDCEQHDLRPSLTSRRNLLRTAALMFSLPVLVSPSLTLAVTQPSKHPDELVRSLALPSHDVQQYIEALSRLSVILGHSLTQASFFAVR